MQMSFCLLNAYFSLLGASYRLRLGKQETSILCVILNKKKIQSISYKCATNVALSERCLLFMHIFE